MQRRHALLAGIAAAATSLAAALVLPSTAQAATGCSVAYANISAWQSTPTSGGFNATVAITNLGDPITHWTLTFTMPAGQTRTGGWNATYTGTTAVTATDIGWNGAIATGATNSSVGIQGDWTRTTSGSTPPSPFPQPTDFALNGVRCGVVVDPSPSRTASPSPSASRSASPSPSPSPSRSTSPSPSSSPSSGGAAPALHVSGNHLVTAGGANYRLLGVNRASAEFACVQGKGMWDSATPDQASVNAMKAWNIRAVRIPLNEECWNGTNGTPNGATYQQAVKDYVALLVANGINPIVEMHWNYGQYSGNGAGCSDVAATCQKPMPDAQYAPTFWTGVANAFKGNNAVLFDLFNEPYPDAAANWDATAAWKCWRDGGTCTGISYQVAGFQSLVNTVRATGATNVIMLGGVAWSNDLSQWLAYKPADSTGNLMAAWHTYNFNSCSNTSCFDSQVAAVAAQVPVHAGEIGQNSCAHDYIDTVMNWLDVHGVGYTAWTWNPWGCGQGNVLITDYNGTPTSTFGEGFKAHLLTQNP